jgi:hypothetical protein
METFRWCVLTIRRLRWKYVCFWKVAQPTGCIVKFTLRVDDTPRVDESSM